MNGDLKTLARTIERMAGSVNQHHAWQQQEIARQQHKAHVEAIVQLAEKLAHTHSYNNVVMGIGYAGFFGLWNILEKSGYPTLRAIAGLSVCVSLVVFVVWEVFRMMYTTYQYDRVQQADGDAQTVQAWTDATGKINKRMDRFWPWAFYPSLGFGLIGAGCLLAAFVRQIIDSLGW